MRRGWARFRAGRVGTPTPANTGNRPMIYETVTPGPSESPIPMHPEPMQVERGSAGMPPDEPLPSEPGEPVPAIPAKPGTPVTERQRTPRTRKA